MNIRTVKTEKNGKTYTQYQLRDSYRTPAGPRNRVVLNLGSNIGITSKIELKLLADTIEMILIGQQPLIPIESELFDMAEKYAREIQSKNLTKKLTEKKEEKLSNPQESKEITPDYEEVDINSIKNFDNKSIGFENVILSQIKEYNLPEILKGIGFTDKETNNAIVNIAGRVCHPSSERETAKWSNESSSIMELLERTDKINDKGLIRAANKLFEHHEEIEKRLAKEAKEQFDLSENIILYDLTNTFFESSKPNSKKAKHGRSKEKRTDCPLMTVALIIDDDGFPKRSQMLEGNIYEGKTLEKTLDQLIDYSNPQQTIEKKTIVMDAGIAKEENIQLLKEKGFSYVAVSRKTNYEEGFFDNSKEEEITLSNGKDKLRMRIARSEDEAFLLCHSEGKEAKEKAILNRKMKKFEEELQTIKDGLKKPRGNKSYEKTVERIGKVKQKYQVASLYDISIEKESSKNKKKPEDIATEIIFKRNDRSVEKLNALGDYVLRTDRMDLTNESISKIHRSLTKIEDCFRVMKSDLGLRPNFHQADYNSMAHMFITVLALHIVTAILKKLQKEGINYKTGTIRNILETHRRVTTTFITADSNLLEIRNTGEANGAQREIYRALKVKQKPLGMVKNKTPFKRE